ncbi:Iron-sulfur cluster co-chaperone protein HscB, mitochondrial [Clonorchis sinensis]|uniref:Iron-sulfur cluster co-chaperone protein HscB, mitochondrial n=2 Tax=Clonorchis sinensis TaxID=79923 RepID=A0A8T1MWS8_CLOSI|nr:Iron-sulfur cluster co-chaperone protein HscB, mitochondrial [Clonorchis sinensis]GAA34393.2 molecular chaperone HscB [Clonorchis sinensis]
MSFRLAPSITRFRRIWTNSLPSYLSSFCLIACQPQHTILWTHENITTHPFPRMFCTLPSNKRQCWNCNRPVRDNEFFCECGKIQPVERDWTYFEVLGYGEPTVHIDLADLAQRMREMQKRLHPDKFSRATPYEQELAADAATFVNRAYAMLEQPESRFAYFLSLHHPSEDASPNTDILDPDFLTEMLELNEEIEEFSELLTAVKEKRHEASKLSVLLKELLHRISQDLMTERAKLVTALDEARWKDAQALLNKCRYLSRTFDRLKEYELDWRRVGITVDIPPH